MIQRREWKRWGLFSVLFQHCARCQGQCRLLRPRNDLLLSEQGVLHRQVRGTRWDALSLGLERTHTDDRSLSHVRLCESGAGGLNAVNVWFYAPSRRQIKDDRLVDLVDGTDTEVQTMEYTPVDRGRSRTLERLIKSSTCSECWARPVRHPEVSFGVVASPAPLAASSPVGRRVRHQHGNGHRQGHHES